MRRSYINVLTCSLEKKGKGWPHKHKWVPLREHPRGGDVSFSFWLESEETDKVEMCLTCTARRIKGVEKKSAVKDADIASYIMAGISCVVIALVIAAAIYAFSRFGNL